MDLSTVGPDSFALAPAQMPTAGPEATYRPLSAGVSGGGVGPAAVAGGVDIGSFQRTSMLDGLLAFGQKTLAPKIEQQRKVMALDGAVAAMQGVTAAELAKGDIFQGFFGDPVAVAAARQVEGVNAVSSALTDIQSSMGEWKKKTPNEFKAMLPEVMKKHFTGDDLSDSIIAQSFMQQIPGIVEMHTKESIKYQNESALAIYSNRARGALQMYQGFADAHNRDNTTTTKDMVQGAEVQLLDELASTLGVMDEKTIGKTTFSLAREMARSGSFAALSALERSPIMGMLSPEQQAMMPKILVDAKNEYMLTNPKFADLYGTAAHFETAVNQAAVSEEKIKEAAVKFTATGLTGYDNEWVKSQIKNLQAAKLREAEALKDDKAALARSTVVTTLANGGSAKHTNMTSKQLQEGMDNDFKALEGNPSAQRNFLLHSARSDFPYPESVRMASGAALRNVGAVGELTPGASMADLETAVALFKTNPGLAVEQFGKGSDELRVLSVLHHVPGVFDPNPEVSKQARATAGTLIKASKGKPPVSELELYKDAENAVSRPWIANITESRKARDREADAIVTDLVDLMRNTGLPAKLALPAVERARQFNTDRIAGIAASGNPERTAAFQKGVFALVSGKYGREHGESNINQQTWEAVTTTAVKNQARVMFNKSVGVDQIVSVTYDTNKDVRVLLDIGGVMQAVTVTQAQVAALYSEAIKVRSKPGFADAMNKHQDALTTGN